jgi:hypothetical protein
LASSAQDVGLYLQINRHRIARGLANVLNAQQPLGGQWQMSERVVFDSSMRRASGNVDQYVKRICKETPQLAG